MAQKPQISLLLRAIEGDLSEAAHRVAVDSEPVSPAQRLSHLMVAADLGLVAAELADRAKVEASVLLMVYEIGRALGPNQAPHEDESVFDPATEP